MRRVIDVGEIRKRYTFSLLLKPEAMNAGGATLNALDLTGANFRSKHPLVGLLVAVLSSCLISVATCYQIGAGSMGYVFGFLIGCIYLTVFVLGDNPHLGFSSLCAVLTLELSYIVAIRIASGPVGPFDAFVIIVAVASVFFSARIFLVALSCGRELAHWKFQDVDVTTSNLSHCKLSDCEFENVILKQAILSESKALRLQIRHCNLENSTWKHACILETFYQDCNMKKVFSVSAQLSDCTISHCTLSEAIYNNARFVRVRFLCCEMRNCSFAEASFSDSEFVNCDITDSDFSGVDSHSLKFDCVTWDAQTIFPKDLARKTA